jgi:hypothetical protein
LMIRRRIEFGDLRIVTWGIRDALQDLQQEMPWQGTRFPHGHTVRRCSDLAAPRVPRYRRP